MRLDLLVDAAFHSIRIVCPISQSAPHYRPDQILDVPDRLRSLVALVHELGDVPECDVNGKRFPDYCALKTLTEALVRDALGCPFGTNVAFFADWKVVAVLPQDQIRYVA